MRTLSSALTTLVAGTAAWRVAHLLSFSVGANNYRFTDGDGTFQGLQHGGNLYLPHLRLAQGPKLSERLRNDPVTVGLQNIDLQMAATLKAEGAIIQGVEATLSRLYLAINEALILFIGRIGEIRINERQAVITLDGDLDPTASQVPRRKYSNLCGWDFKDADCGYTDGVDPDDPLTSLPYTACDKDFLSCTARSREERFPGFIHITRDLTEAVEGQVPDEEEDDDWHDDDYE